MTTSPSIKSIEAAIDKYRSKNVHIEENSSVQFLNDLKYHILNNSDDRGKAVHVFSTVLRFSKPNNAFIPIFDEPLLDAIFKVIAPTTTLEVINSALRILSSVVTGSAFDSASQSQYVIPLLNSANTNLGILEVIAAKLFLENVNLMVNGLNFINGYFDIDHGNFNSINHLTEFTLHLQRSEYLLLIVNFSNDERFSKSLEAPMAHTQVSYHSMVSLLLKLPVDPTSKYQNELLSIILSQVTKTETELKRKLILEEFSVFHLIDLYFFLENTNISFKKAYHQQVLFNSSANHKFPLPLSSLKVSDFLMKIFGDEGIEGYKNIQKYFFLRDLFQYNLISKFLEIWVESKAVRDDFDNLFILLELLLQHVNDQLNPEGEINIVEKITKVFKDTSYQNLRDIQLQNFKNKVHKITRTETSKFLKLLNDQTFEFVKNQRFLALSKGDWVYADLPSFKNQTQTPSSYYFIILSPNHKQLLYKEFKTTSTNKPNIDKSGTPIDISSISNFDIEEIHQVDQTAPPSSSTRLINLVNKTIINRITLVNRKNKQLFSFYAKKDHSLVWLDGLNLLIGNYDHLSNELKFQLNKLYEIRKTVQLSNLDEDSLKKAAGEIDPVDEQRMNDLKYLESLTKNFYYT